MPANYSPNPANLWATITVPVSGDAPNASGVTTPLEQLADNIANVQANYLPLSGGTMTGDIELVTTGSFPFVVGAALDDENNNSHAGLISNVQAANGHKKLLAQWKAGPSVGGSPIYGRLFSSGTGANSQLEETVNAFWNDVSQTWGYDVNSQPATRRINASDVTQIENYNGATGWADGAWNASVIIESGAGTDGIDTFGSGAGAGITAVGGLTGPGGVFAAGATSGQGVQAFGSGANEGLFAQGGSGGVGATIEANEGVTTGANAHGAVIAGAGTGYGAVGNGGGAGGGGLLGSGGVGGNGVGVTGNGTGTAQGGYFRGGSGGGDGINAAATASNGNGATLTGHGSGAGAVVAGGATGPGLLATSTANVGANLSGNASHGPVLLTPASSAPTRATAVDGELYVDDTHGWLSLHMVGGWLDPHTAAGGETDSGEQSVTLTSWDGGLGGGALYYWRDLLGVVHMELAGLISVGATFPVNLTTLPLGYTPTRDQTFLCWNTNADTWIEIKVDTGGVVSINGVNGAVAMSQSGMVFHI